MICVYKQFVLKNKDIDILRFKIDEGMYGDYELTILETYNTSPTLYPIALKNGDSEALLDWLKQRNIPKNRAFVNEILGSLELTRNDLNGILNIGKGLSLNDPYWVVEPEFKGEYKAYNLYDNAFNESISNIAFTGRGRNDEVGNIAELSTNGTLNKAWRRIDGDVVLYKGNIQRYNTGGYEPYAEYYAYKVAEQMGLNVVAYDLDMWHCQLASVCKLFTSIDTSFVPVSRFLKRYNLRSVVEFYKSLGEDFYQDFCSMMVFDALICNVDRHLNNFGVLVDNRTNKIKCMAPLFDHGNCMFNKPKEDLYESTYTFEKHINTLYPILWNSFEKNVEHFMSERQKQELSRVLGYTLPKHDKYNMLDDKLDVLNQVLQNRAKNIIEHIIV